MTGPSSEQAATLIPLKRWDEVVAAVDRLLAGTLTMAGRGASVLSP